MTPQERLGMEAMTRRTSRAITTFAALAVFMIVLSASVGLLSQEPNAGIPVLVIAAVDVLAMIYFLTLAIRMKRAARRRHIYVQPDEPKDAREGDVWIRQ